MFQCVCVVSLVLLLVGVVESAVETIWCECFEAHYPSIFMCFEDCCVFVFVVVYHLFYDGDFGVSVEDVVC